MISFKTFVAAFALVATACTTSAVAGSTGGSAPVRTEGATSTMATTAVLANTRELGQFNTLLNTASLKRSLDKSATAYTIFAPTNDAIRKVPAEIREKMFVGNNPALRQLVQRHIVAGNVDLTRLSDGATLTTLSGETLRVDKQADGSVLINGVYRVQNGRPTANGMVYSIDTMIAPTK